MRIEKEAISTAREDFPDPGGAIKFKRFIFHFKMESKTADRNKFIISGHSYYKNPGAAGGDKELEPLTITRFGGFIETADVQTFATIEMRERDIARVIPDDDNYTFVRLTPDRISTGEMTIIAESFFELRVKGKRTVFQSKGRTRLNPSPPSKPDL